MNDPIIINLCNDLHCTQFKRHIVEVGGKTLDFCCENAFNDFTNNKIKTNAYLFSFIGWKYDPPRYILINAKDEESARIEACKHLAFNSGKRPEPKDLHNCTFFATY